MRLLIVRHGAPEYERDTLTEQGWREAELLGARLEREKPDFIYLSPLGRAQDTAAETLRRTGLTPTVLPWLCEFDRRLPPPAENWAPWHLDPAVWLSDPEYRGLRWKETDLFRDTPFLKQYEADGEELDALLAKHGYVRRGVAFDVTPEYYDINETIVFFCHLGRGVVLLSQLLSLPWVVAAHQFWLPTSSVTEIIFERSRFNRSVAIARCAALGSVSHLDALGIKRCNSGFLMPIDGYTSALDAPSTEAKV